MRGQPDLFTKRVRKPPAAYEFAVHCMVADVLRLNIQPGWIWFHPPNGGERSSFTNKQGKRVSPEGGRLQRMGAMPGVSDFILVAPAWRQAACARAEAEGREAHPTRSMRSCSTW